MIGAIIGDIVGSVYEFHNHKSKEFEFFPPKCFFTDDSVMTIAIANALMTCQSDFSDLSEKAIESMQTLGRAYSNRGYGGSFYSWLFSPNPFPYNSFGNGAAMRVSACGFVGKTLEETIQLSRNVTEVTHNHSEGIKGAEATSVAIFLAKSKKTKEEIKKYIEDSYYPLSFTLDEIRPTYKYSVTCQGTVPQALVAFFESTSFEDAIRNAISIGGDSDTLAAITGGIAQAYYSVPQELEEKMYSYLDDKLSNIVKEFKGKFIK